MCTTVVSTQKYNDNTYTDMSPAGLFPVEVVPHATAGLIKWAHYDKTEAKGKHKRKTKCAQPLLVHKNITTIPTTTCPKLKYVFGHAHVSYLLNKDI